MLFFLDMPNNICGDSSSNADSHSWLWIGLWLCLYKIYAASLMALCSGESTSDETTYSRRCLLSNVKEHLLVSICPRRRARFLKCQQRRRKTCRRRDDEEGDSNESHQESASSSSSCCRQADQCCDKLCEFGKAFFKLHLPPPLPFFKRRKSKQQNASCPDDAADNDTSSSSGDSSTSETITKPPQHTVPQPLQKPSRSSSTLLIDMARMQQWNVLLNHVNRRGAKHRDQDGLHPLHWACSGSPPLAVVQALLDAYPSAARKLDAEGSTPLHFATHYAAPLAVMECLLMAYPKAVKMQDKYGRTPLYHAVEKSLSLDVIKLLVNVDAGCILLPCLPKSKRTAAPVETRDVAVRTPLYLAWASALKDRSTRLKCKGKQWDKAEWLLQQAAMTRANVDAKSLLEQIVTMDLFMPEQLVNFVLHARPELGNEPNALMTAASMQHYSCERAIHLIRALLHHNTAAASALTGNGRSILACAANANQPWEVIQALFEFSPEMIQWRDARTGLAPAMLAAASEQVTVMRQGVHGVIDSDPYNLLPAKEKELLNASTMTTMPSTSLEAPINHDALHLNTIYNLLQMDPSVVWNASNRPLSRPILMA
ncbi:hypothetical protein MPSEU_000831000 [Mayamaea pseudoterrestris]|nr:hypothetical protein MPSEU_000831000 [Mayamaea pseudoterrestris]